jgi:hypothetical protein
MPSRGALLLDFYLSEKSFMELHNAVMRNTHLSTGQSGDNTWLTILYLRLAVEGQIIRWGGIVMYLELT